MRAQVSQPATSPTPAQQLEALNRPDGCPSCVVNVETPYVAEIVDREARCAYACTDCGHWWTTSWKVA